MSDKAGFMKVTDWTKKDIDLRAFFASAPLFTSMFKECHVLTDSGALDSQCFNMNTLA